jgi:ribosomal protein L23
MTELRRKKHMTLWEIDKALAELIDSLIDTETGELVNTEKLDELLLNRDKKIESIAHIWQNTIAEVNALKETKKRFEDRIKRAENKAKRLEYLLETSLKGQPFKTTEVEITYKQSERVDITDTEAFFRFAKRNKQYVIAQDPKPDKNAIKEAIKQGLKVKGAEIQTISNMQIK